MTDTPQMKFLPVGAAALLVELEDLGQALTLLDQLLSAPVPGIEEVVPAARTVLVRFDPKEISALQIVSHVRSLDLSLRSARSGRSFDIPVSYDGPDLAEVAELLGWTVETLIRRHEEANYKVAFTGFAPGFAYLSGSDPALVVPRRQSPRVRIPAGSVALAGAFCGIYPSDSPGGWQLLGRTDLQMWDLDRPRPALLAPGDRVQFRNIARGDQILLDKKATAPTEPKTAASSVPGIVVLRTDRPILFQDLGRTGQAAQGVSGSGAADRQSFRAANALVGNRLGSPALEIVLGGVVLRAELAVTMALTGADAPLTIRREGRTDAHVSHASPFALDPHDELIIGTSKTGLFSYLALRGGYQVASVMGSAASDSLAKIGPAPLVSRDRLVPASLPAGSVSAHLTTDQSLPKAGEIVTLDVILGPRDDWFSTTGLITFTDQTWDVSADSNRVGKRLIGAAPIERLDAAELLSEPTVAGSIQIPHSGQPVLFLADHPLTGGYPVIAVIADYHLDLAAQIPPGGKIRFRPIASPLRKAEK